MGLTNKLGLLAQSVQQDASLNIGIGGAANASYKLQVTGTTNLTGALSGTSATFSSSVNLGTSLNSTTAAMVVENAGIYGSWVELKATSTGGKRWIVQSTGVSAGEGAGKFVINNATDAVNAVVINSSGNVGIGTSNPSTLLNVVKSDNGTGAIASFAANNLTQQLEIWYAGIKMGGTSTNVGLYLSSKNTGSIYFETNATQKMEITSAGTVVIGSLLTAPTGGETGWWIRNGNRAYFSSTSEALTCNRYGSTGVLLNFDYAGATVGSISYNGTTTVLNPTSDQRLKENIVDSGSGLDKLSKVKIRAYDWKESGMHTDFGIIAQEIFEVAPECVTVGTDEIDKNGKLKNPWCAQPYVLVSAAVKAIQELNQIVIELEARIKQLENK